MEKLSFKEWFIITEMGHVALPKAIKYRGTKFELLDLRMEDYPKDTEEDQNLIRSLMKLPPPPYYGKFPDKNRYLVFNGLSHTIEVELPVFPSSYWKTNYNYTIELPCPFKNGYTWWDYAACYNLDNEMVKQPLVLRNVDIPEPPTRISPDDVVGRQAVGSF